ncbi:putative L-type lectin-domain containing receptor kinase S.7 [Dichanthelium oligosanthes]|uniref:Putative L-type lectin-domain containing receptor kinase S.7 n=1 Tax=Dichanthelium oligosanthes TaxID=888268 RepID=A0A1E5WJ51_9POAL|nr:putative L-type lectin-domain containing receptor kinase S.7 [Dichanthelium oligosanthes]
MTTEPWRRGGRAAPSLELLLLLLACVVACSIPVVRAQVTMFTGTVAGRDITSFSFPWFDQDLIKQSNLTFAGNTSIGSRSLQITPDSLNNPQVYLVNQTGHIFYSTPFVLWAANASNSTPDGRRVASFSTVMKLNLYRGANTSVKGEGLAFVIASGKDGGPPPGSYGGYLGLTNVSTDGLPTNGFAAVELDTVKQSYDPDDNHVGLDVNSVHSTVTAPLAPFGIELAPSNATATGGNDGSNFMWIDYNGTARHVWVYLSPNENKPATAVLNASLDLSKVLLDNKGYFGFSGSTGATYELNCVNMWNMTVDVLPGGSVPKKKLPGWKLGVFIGVPCAAALALGLLAGLYFMKKRRKQVGDDPSSVFNNAIDFRSIPGVPREFDYRELRKGTNNFDEKMKLGQGGYGVVYRATVAGDSGQSMEVAVKQFSGANTKGQEDFLAELSIINRLRHRNLVKLVGWCHDNGVLLLVYDYMPNGSLDRHLFGGKDAPSLDWKQRYNVVAGVASALNYLHHEFDQTVIHRDIKPSNIMLDSSFHARLGDFGLARALESDKTSYTDKIGVPGTLGYIAPECFHTGRATRESDVFGFGAVILEIVCGRRISCSNPAGCSQLLEAVWRLHGAGRVLEAVDPRLGGEYDDEDAERLLLLGLACSHPNPRQRPKASAILQNLQTRSVPPLPVPASKPVFMWPVPLGNGEVEEGEYGEEALTSMSHSGVASSDVTSSSHYAYASSSGCTTQNYPVSRELHDVAERDVSTV